MSNMQTNQTPEALAEEARGHAVRVAIHAYNRGMDDMSDGPLRAASANNHRDVQLAEAAALEACIYRLRDMAASAAKDAEALDWLGHQFVTVRIPLRYGSKECFMGSPDDNDGESVPWDIRGKVHAAIAATKRG